MSRDRDREALLYEEEESRRPRMVRDRQGFLRRDDLHYEFDCPACDANNPWDDGFTDRSEIRCHYCGEEFVVQINGEGKRRLKPA